MSDALVSVQKEGETLQVHPSCVAAHVQAGWAVCLEQPPTQTEPTPQVKPKRAKAQE